LNKEESFIESSLGEKDIQFETPLRPQSLKEFMGQETICKRLEIFTKAALQRQEALGHVLFCGPPGLGKTSLAHILSKTMGTKIIVTSGPIIEKPKDLAGILTNLQFGDILFIDEIHRLSKAVEEYLYPAMEDFSLDLIIDTGPNARSVQIKLSPFTLIGATTKAGLLSSPMRSRFGISLRLDYYCPAILQTICLRSANIMHCLLEPAAALEIARRSRGTPRVANNLFRWVRDFAQTKGNKKIDLTIAKKALEMLCIDHKGLDEMDKKILSVMIDYYGGGPVGLNTLAAAIGEESSTLEEVYEPFLMIQGFIQRTPRGRIVTDLAYKHLQKNQPQRNDL
jgi:holliday junction DNA helicase RuvB